MKLRLALTSLATILAAAFAASAVRAGDKPAAKPYPLTTCVVSGEKLDSMGKPYVHEHEGLEVQFCCKNCLKDFNKDPGKYVKMVRDAQAKK